MTPKCRAGKYITSRMRSQEHLTSVGAEPNVFDDDEDKMGHRLRLEMSVFFLDNT